MWDAVVKYDFVCWRCCCYVGKLFGKGKGLFIDGLFGEVGLLNFWLLFYFSYVQLDF